jgi:oligosaccharide repeat unit polymerase
VSRLIWGTEPTELDIPFIQAHLLGVVGLLAGLLGGKLLVPPKAQIQRVTPLPAYRCGALAVAAFLAIFAYFYYSVGFSLSNMFKPYGFEATLRSESSTLDMLALPAGIAMLLHCYLSASASREMRPALHRFVIAIAVLASMVFLIRGIRNSVQILWLPIFALATRSRRIPVIKAAVAAGAVFILFSVVAAVRSIGLLSAETVEIGNSVLDPLHGELGTSYHVFNIFSSTPSGDGLQLGRSYTIDLGINLVPHSLWPNRPPSTAEKFSMRYFGTDHLSEGLGFSPVVEAIENFSEAGIPFVFALFAFGVVFASNYFRGAGRWGMLSYSMMLPMLVNWNRIDSTTSFKMFVVYCSFFIIFGRLIYIGVRDRAQVAPVSTRRSGNGYAESGSKDLPARAQTAR